eukprot:TRINITY_DN7162_c0_g1_i1.p1 TRINITY_DN7162_c0_g1~~TRINITY_DN7162_c0_g1_i1.p1  ORF type:complete len:445 (+),score=50.01 TRINITY_DN7162_c0_g1_i1:26-1360(+)
MSERKETSHRRKKKIALILLLLIGAIVALSYLGATNQLDVSSRSSGSSSSNATTTTTTTTTATTTTTTTTTTDPGPQYDVLQSGVAHDVFGRDAIAIFNGTIAVGATHAEAKVYLYSIAANNTISLVQTLVDAMPYTTMHSAFSADGLLAVASNSRATGKPGGLRIYSRHSNGQYVEEQFLANIDCEKTGFGNSILMPDTSTIIVAAAQGTPSETFEAGQVFVYRKDNVTSSFDLAQVLEASDATEGAEFGNDIAAHGDLLAVAAVHAETGAVYIFKQMSSSEGYVQVLKLTPSDAGAGLEFGFKVQMNTNRLFVSSIQRNDSRGAVYVFEYEQLQFNETAIITSPFEQVDGYFGFGMGSLNDDLLIAEIRPRSVHRYSLNSSAASGYSLVGTIAPDDNLTSPTGMFGGALASDDSTLLASYNFPSVPLSSVYVYFPHAVWTAT